jgi:hypothetical protein
MAEQRIADGFRSFDDGYASLERELPRLSDLEITPRINKLIAILNPIGANFESIGMPCFLFQFNFVPFVHSSITFLSFSRFVLTSSLLRPTRRCGQGEQIRGRVEWPHAKV